MNWSKAFDARPSQECIGRRQRFFYIPIDLKKFDSKTSVFADIVNVK